MTKGSPTLEKAVKMEKDLGYSEPPYYPRPTLLSLAAAYIKKGEFEKAESCYEKILDKHPNSAIAYWGQMKLYKAQKQQDKYEGIKSTFDAITQYGDKAVFK